MAVLSEEERKTLWSRFMSDESSEFKPMLMGKADVRAAVDAVDSWVDANAASYNQALPLPARTALTAGQKAQLLMYVVRRRFEIS